MAILHENNIDKKLLKQFGVTYSSEAALTIARMKRGKGFSYSDTETGETVSDVETERLIALAVPPTYSNVLYANNSKAHIQAVGHDANGKKQYFYHAQWETLRDYNKFNMLEAFGQRLPAFRRKLLNDIKAENIIAVMVRVMDKTGIRIGSEEATDSNETYGLTTLLPEHISVENSHITIDYIGKGGVAIKQGFADKLIAARLKKLKKAVRDSFFIVNDLPVRPEQINAYIKEKLGENFSAKDFRTWRFNAIFIENFLRLSRQNAPTLKSVLDATAKKTGNTPSILQSSYIHPGLIELVKENDRKLLIKNPSHKVGLKQSEAAFLYYLVTSHAKGSLK
jgi:DNA topoisomerase-1